MSEVVPALREREVGTSDVLRGRPTDREITQQLLRPVWNGYPGFGKLLLLTGLGTAVLFASLLYTFTTGIGVWGNNIPVAWAFGIINFVWWIGIGHAGTFISAILLLLEQRWRTSINRLAEAMTLFAVLNAALFPLAHLGRVWFFYWLIPYPSTMEIWPQFKSALTWDVVAISTYFTVSVLFWYLGLLPDLALARDCAPTLCKRRIYGFFALGWRGSAKGWRHYRMAYGLLAGLATPLVLSVHSIVSFDFSTSKLPGWHSTIFPPYFVAGAILSGFAMVLTLMIPTRKFFRLENFITVKHLESMGIVLLITGSMVGYSYAVEHFLAFYSGNPYEHYVILKARPFGPTAFIYWITIICNVFFPQLFWSQTMRRSSLALFVGAMAVNVGMWTERFMIIAGSLSRDYLVSSWHDYVPTPIDWCIFCGTISFFLFLYLLFIRYVPFIPITEIKEMKHEIAAEEAHSHS